MKEGFQITPEELLALVRLQLQRLGGWEKYMDGPAMPGEALCKQVRTDATRFLELLQMLEDATQ